MHYRQFATSGACVLAAWMTTTQADAAIWRRAQPFVGVTHWQFIETQADTTSTPQYAREVVVNIMEIDLGATGIGFQMSPGNGADPGEITRQTTRSYTNQANAQIGINVGFYDTGSTYGGLYTDLIHMGASNGNVYSTAAGGEPLANISATNQVRIGAAGAAGSSAFNSGTTTLYNAFGGNQRILNGGALSAPNDSYTNTLNPHTAFGVNQAGTRAYLAVVDGRQGEYSGGMTTLELAQVMKDRGAWNAINLDGGGSSTMVMDDSSDGVQNSRVVNSPSDSSTAYVRGSERVVANNLVVFAAPNVGYTPLAAIPRPAAPVPEGVLNTLTVIDNFEGTKGKFASGVTASGSNRNIGSGTTTLDTNQSALGDSSLRLTFAPPATPTSGQGTQLRFLSGGGTTTNNYTDGKTVGNVGHFGVFLRMEAGSAPLFVSMLIDDNAASAGERSSFKQVVADGKWHLYQWDLADVDDWSNFSGGDGDIDGPNVFLDSLYFSGTAGTSGGPVLGSTTVWIDGVAYNPSGTLDALVPEPATLAAIGLGAVMFRRRRRR